MNHRTISRSEHATVFSASCGWDGTWAGYTPEFHHHLSDLSAYSDEDLKATAALGVGLLTLKHIFRPDLRARLLPEIIKIEEVGVLKAIHEGIRSVERPEDLRQFYV